MATLALDPATTPGYSPVSSAGASATAQPAPRSDGTLILSIQVAPTPPWLFEVEVRLNELLNLGSGWNTYGAQAIEPSHVVDGVTLLFQLLPLEGSAPWTVPTARRGVQFEWRFEDVEVEARVDDDGAHVFVMDQAGEDEGDPGQRLDLRERAARAIAMIAPV